MKILRRNSNLRSLCLALAAVAALGVVSPAGAGTITQTLDFRLNAGTASSTLHFDPFDSLLGTLDSVDISFDATRRHSWAIWNVSAAPGAVPYDVTLTDTTFTIDGNLFGFADLHYGPANTPVLGVTGFPDYLFQFLAGQDQFLAGDEPDFGPTAFQPATTYTAITDSFAASSFTGVLNLAYAYDPGVFKIDSNGTFAGSLVDVFGDVTVTYGYTPHAVSDSGATLGLLTASLGLLIAVRRPLAFLSRR